MNFFSHPHILTRWAYAGILFLLPFIACQSGETPITRFENSPIIDSLLAAAPHFVVSTDTEPERWVAKTRIGLPNDSLILGQPAHMMAMGDSVYISQYPPSHIFSVGADGYLSRQIGRPGEGPGEFNFISGLQYNGSLVFVKEMERVQVFTEKFEYLDSFFSLDVEHGRFSVSPDYMFLQCPWDTPQEYDWLVCARSTLPPYDWIPSIKLLPGLDLPNQTGENSNIVTVTPRGDLTAVAYWGLPYIFVYDERFRHLRTIRFEGEDVRNFSPTGFPDGFPAQGDAYTQGFFLTTKFINSRHLIVVVASLSQGSYFLFDLSGDDFEFAKRIALRPMSDTEEDGDIPGMDFLLHGEHLYVSSPFEEYVYGYEFDLE